MTDVTNDLKKPTRKAVRATRAAAKTARATAKTVANEARTFGNRSKATLKSAAPKLARNAKTVRSAGDDAADIASNRLRAALDSLQQTSTEMSKWAGARANEARDNATQAVQERPLGAIGTIFAVGALIGIVAGIALKN